MNFCGEFLKNSLWEACVLEQSCREGGGEKVKLLCMFLILFHLSCSISDYKARTERRRIATS
jgi:hypothetical protein